MQKRGWVKHFWEELLNLLKVVVCFRVPLLIRLMEVAKCGIPSDFQVKIPHLLSLYLTPTALSKFN